MIEVYIALTSLIWAVVSDEKRRLALFRLSTPNSPLDRQLSSTQGGCNQPLS